MAAMQSALRMIAIGERLPGDADSASSRATRECEGIGGSRRSCQRPGLQREWLELTQLDFHNGQKPRPASPPWIRNPSQILKQDPARRSVQFMMHQ
ncbi:hypothetical protein CEE69_00595 [Rhodopirellula bahusiensis]|uniref:Uncharacterized protein n=1 Tax=Rhodopirellula bahusiensis TaxID=2014065 RepID=A0A2G1WCZ6_9BACT|nr:hypothetical protein CEE69_00595 [Rhodopirellula bahusiensis]